MGRGLSKSKILSSPACPKRLYLEVHLPELAAVEEKGRFRMDMGAEANRVARGPHRDGVMIEVAGDPQAAPGATREHLRRAFAESLLEAGAGPLLVSSPYERRILPGLGARDRSIPVDRDRYAG